jgi:2-iminobutanoate/2-iminopropanoate deaminase
MYSISTPNAPYMAGPFSQGSSAGRFVFVSGQLPLVPGTGKFVEGDIQAMCLQSIKNCEAVLQDVGLGLTDVAKVTIYLTNIADISKVNAVYEQCFSRPYPARTTVEVAALSNGSPIEIECIAIR